MIKYFSKFILVFSSFICHSQIVFNGSSTSGATGASSLTFSKTVASGNNSLLYVGVTTQNQNISSVTWGGLSLTQFTIGTRNSMRVAMYYIALGNIASPTTSNVVVTLAGGTDVFAGAADYSGVWQAAPFVNPTIAQAKNTTPSITFASSVGNKAVSLLGVIAASPNANGSGQTQYWSLSGTHSNRSTEKAGASSVTMSHTISASEDWVLIGGTMQDYAVLLPIELSEFTGLCRTKSYDIHWTTITEKNTNYFELERSLDGITWAKITQIKAKTNTLTESNYSYEDLYKAYVPVYYKLVLYDLDGSSSTLKILQPECLTTLENQFTLYPNPNKGHMSINFELNKLYGNCFIQIINEAGMLNLEKEIFLHQTKFCKTMDIDLPSGLYHIILRDSFNSILFQKSLVVNCDN